MATQSSAYALGIDIGTAYTTVAVSRPGGAEVVTLGGRSSSIPSVLFLRPDGSFLTGESALRRGLGEPNRVAREFARRLGETSPLLLGGAPYSAMALTGRLLRSVLDAVGAREGGPPASIGVAHPASWGPYQMDLLRQVVRLADVEQPVRFVPAAQAVATCYARRVPLGPGAVLAVYDLGAVLEAAVLRRTATGFELIGGAEGADRLGGTDFDAKILARVAESAGVVLDQPNRNDPAIARLREECVQAKEVLSADTEATIQVSLPGAGRQVRLGRADLEEMVRPALRESIDVLRRTMLSAGYAPEAVGTVLLVGGSSRMPIVAETVAAQLGRPVEVDADPQHVVALGAALLASADTPVVAPAPVVPAPVVAPPPVMAPIPVVAPPPLVAPIPVVAPPPLVAPIPVVAPRPEVVPGARFEDSTAESGERTGEIRGPVATPAPRPVGTNTGGPSTRFTGSVPFGGPAQPHPVPPPPVQPPRTTRRRLPVIVAAAAVLVLAATGTAWALGRSGDRGGVPRAAGAVQSASASVAAKAVAAADELCTAEMKKSTRWVCLTKATLHDNTLTIRYDAEWHGSRPDIQSGFHLHIYGGDGIHPDESTMGSQAVRHSKYYFEDKEPSVRRTTDPDFQAVRDATKVCARIADSGHGLAKAHDGSYHTGNCVPIQR